MRKLYFWCRRCIVLTFALTLLGGGWFAWYVYMHYTNPETVRRLALDAARKALPGAVVELESADFCFFGGITLRQLEVSDRDDQGVLHKLVRFDAVHVTPDRDKLLQGQLRFDAATIDGPQLFLRQDDEGNWNISKWLKDQPIVVPYDVKVRVRQGSLAVEFNDELLPRIEIDQLEAQFAVEAPSGISTQLALRHPVLGKLHISVDGDGATKDFKLQAETEKAVSIAQLIQALPEQLQSAAAEWKDVQGEAKISATGSIKRIEGGGFDSDAAVTAKLANVAFSKPSLPYPVTNAEATITVQRSGMDVRNLRFSFGPSWGEGSARLPEWDADQFSCEGSLWGLPMSREVYSSLPPMHQATWDKFDPRGKIDVHGDAQVVDGRLQLTGSADLNEISFRFHRFPLPVEHIKGKIAVHADGHVSFEGGGMVNNRPVTLRRGYVQRIEPKSALEFEYSVDNLPINDEVIDAFSALPPGVKIAVDKLATIKDADGVYGVCNVVGRFHRERGRQPVEFDVDVDLRCPKIRSEWFPYTVHNMTGRVNTTRFKTEFTDCVGTSGHAVVKLDGAVTKFTDGTHVEVVVEASNVPLDEKLKDALPSSWSTAWQAVQPQGRVGINCYIIKEPKRNVDVRLRLDPKHAVVTPVHFPYRLHNLQGLIEYADGVVSWKGKPGTAKRFGAQHGNVVLTGDGSVETTSQGGLFSLQMLTCRSLPVDDDLLSALPPQVRACAEFFEPDRPIQLGLTKFTVGWSGDGRTPVTTEFNGYVGLGNCKLMSSTVGAENVSGIVTLEGRCTPNQHRVVGNVNLRALKLAGYEITDAHANLDVQNNNVKLTSLEARMYGGGLKGRLDAGLNKPWYEAKLELRGASLVTYLQRTQKSPPTVAGIVDANLTLNGQGETIGTLNGNGSVLLRNADLVRFPLVLDIIRIVNLETPNDRVFDDVRCDFYLRDRLMLIRDLSLMGPSLSLRSEPGGRLNIDTTQLDVNLRARWGKGGLRVPLISDTLNTANDQLYLVRVTGSLRHPIVVPEPLPGLRRFFEGGARFLDRIGGQ